MAEPEASPFGIGATASDSIDWVGANSTRVFAAMVDVEAGVQKLRVRAYRLDGTVDPLFATGGEHLYDPGTTGIRDP